MKIRYSIPVIFLCIALFLASCDKKDITPSFIEITEAQLADLIDVSNYNQLHETNYDVDELAAIRSSLFRDVWVYVGNDSRGVYKLPCKIPILASDSCTVTIAPAIRLNGLSTVLPAYPYVNNFSKRYFLEKDKNTVIPVDDIVFTYINRVTFAVLETFEAGTIFSRLDADTGATFQTVELGEEKVGYIALDAENTFFDLVSDGLRLPGYGSSVILEIDYKCDADFAVSLLLNNSSGYQTHDALINVKKTDEWKKVYVNLTQSISRNYVGSDGYATNVKIYLSAGVNYDDNGQAIPTNFYMDNIKVLYIE
ncbi:hypothetical protein LJC68_07855 [Bacteroidales bacterium OttesenSCG-928-B11]|nr:hypothetical protein [Bacteroidales bacterium OttesenSCG-928-B11]